MDEYEVLAETLNKNPHIPRARRIRDNFDSIERILSTGVPIKYLVTRLNNHGFLITVDTFKIELYRTRKKLKKQIIHKQSNNSAPVIITEEIPKEQEVDFSNLSIRERIKLTEKSLLEEEEIAISPKVLRFINQQKDAGK